MSIEDGLAIVGYGALVAGLALIGVEVALIGGGGLLLAIALLAVVRKARR